VIDDLQRFIDQVSNPADLATVLIAGTAGFLVDAWLNFIGFLEPGYVGIIAASIALGLKKAVEASLKTRRLRERAKNLLALLRNSQKDELVKRNSQKDELVKRLEKEIELFNKGIIHTNDFQASVGEIIKSYHKGFQGQQLP
jgi:hypothetical protein